MACLMLLEEWLCNIQGKTQENGDTEEAQTLVLSTGETEQKAELRIAPTDRELDRAAARMDGGTAAGWDGIPMSLVKAAGLGAHHLCQLLNKMGTSDTQSAGPIPPTHGLSGNRTGRSAGGSASSQYKAAGAADAYDGTTTHSTVASGWAFNVRLGKRRWGLHHGTICALPPAFRLAGSPFTGNSANAGCFGAVRRTTRGRVTYLPD
ncbi:hypothetical protein MTO96_049786 [Rhipicephalus appendiculatus]